MTPSEVLYSYKVVGAKIHQAGIAFGETKKAANPADAKQRLVIAAEALREALEGVERLMK